MHPYRSDNYSLFREQLIQYFEFKLGFRIRNISDCHRAANEMRAQKASLSAHTIARLFKIIGPETIPYKSTLDVVAKFCGFLNFDHYVDTFEKSHELNSFNLQLLVNSNNAKIESALRLAFQTLDQSSIHQLIEHFEEDPFNLWLQNSAGFLYSFEPAKRLKLLDILAHSNLGRKYFYDYYVNENDPDGSFSFALEAFYLKNSSDKNAELFTLVFQTIQQIYKGASCNQKSINRIKALKYENPIDELGFHLASRLKEIDILINQPKNNVEFLKLIDIILLQAHKLSLFEKTWYFARILRAFSFLHEINKILDVDEFRIELEKCFFYQANAINYPPAMIIQTCLHAYWANKRIEHEHLFVMHHPLMAQNEENSIKVMEDFGIALYDNTLIGKSIKRNLPLVLKSNGVLWMNGLLPAFNN